MTEENIRTRVAIDEVAWTGEPHDLADFLDTLRQVHGVRIISIFTVGMKMYALSEQDIDVEREKTLNRQRQELEENEPKFNVQLKLKRRDGDPIEARALAEQVKEALLDYDIYADSGFEEDTGYVIADVKVLVRKRRRGES